MAGRIRSHIRSNVVGYIALVIALSGTASAIILQAPAGFDAVKGLETRGQRVLEVPGVGVVTARCDEVGVIINWKNTTPGTQRIIVDDGSTEQSAHTLRSGAIHGIIIYGEPVDHAQLLAFKPTDRGTPMANVGVWMQFGGECASALVAAQSLSSEVTG